MIGFFGVRTSVAGSDAPSVECRQKYQNAGMESRKTRSETADGMYLSKFSSVRLAVKRTSSLTSRMEFTFDLRCSRIIFSSSSSAIFRRNAECARAQTEKMNASATGYSVSVKVSMPAHFVAGPATMTTSARMKDRIRDMMAMRPASLARSMVPLRSPLFMI